MVFRRSASSNNISGFSSPTSETPENNHGKFRSASVSAQDGKSYLRSSSQHQLLPTALSARTVKHVTTVKACITLARLLSGVSQTARSFVVSRSKDLVHTLLQKDDPQAQNTAHQLIDKLGKLNKHQKVQNEDLADWCCNAYSQLGQQYAEANATESLTHVAESMKEELQYCSTGHSRPVRMSLANAYQTIAEQHLSKKTQAANKEAAYYVVNIAQFSKDPRLGEWQVQRANDVLKLIHNSSKHEVHNFAARFMKDLQANAIDSHKVRLFLQPYKMDIAPTLFVTEHLSDAETIKMQADNSSPPQKVVIYGRNSDQITERVETMYQTKGEVEGSDNAYRGISLSSGSVEMMASEPVSQSEATRVAQQQLSKRFTAGETTVLPSDSTDYTMDQLSPAQSDRVLFYTDINALYHQPEQWQKDLQNFVVMMNCSPTDKLSRWKRVRFLINCDGLTNPPDINLRRQGIMNSVNKLLKPMGLTMDEGHFVMTAALSRELPEAYRDDLYRQFTPDADVFFPEH